MSSKKILVSIVDDEQDIRTLFRDALQGIHGISIFTFSDPIIALEHFTINKTAYALIISDLRMPGLCGTELLQKVKIMKPLVRTILITAFAADDVLFQKYEKHEIINAFLEKPIRLDRLRNEVNDQLKEYKLMKQKSLIKIK